MGICSCSNNIFIDSNPRELCSVNINNAILKVIYGDILRETSQAIANPASSGLLNKIWNDALILKAGSSLLDEVTSFSMKNGHLPVGSVFETGPGNLGCKFVIHAVVPVYIDGNQGEKNYLMKTLWKILLKSVELKCTSVSIPQLSSGAFAFPREEGSDIMLKTITSFFEKNENSPLKEVRILSTELASVNLLKKLMLKNFDLVKDGRLRCRSFGLEDIKIFE
ncbi:unnamed protein product [Blepharisma stoltei]|uniref:Macro domain-containing protein n=1 Tax=Blepharisma stoltei TaxID=1481888 RepID=A0AAU9K959_9CILI|nr:unnamed protein product [Blepharisma stoltei]